jgi:hypothetical protein
MFILQKDSDIEKISNFKNVCILKITRLKNSSIYEMLFIFEIKKYQNFQIKKCSI